MCVRVHACVHCKSDASLKIFFTFLHSNSVLFCSPSLDAANVLAAIANDINCKHRKTVQGLVDRLDLQDIYNYSTGFDMFKNVAGLYVFYVDKSHYGSFGLGWQIQMQIVGQ